MSLLLNLQCNGIAKKIYFIYNFNQVDDEILLVLFNNERKSWQKIPIDYHKNFWNTNKLNNCTDTQTLQHINKKLKIIFKQRSKLVKENLNHFRFLPDHALLLFNGCS